MTLDYTTMTKANLLAALEEKETALEQAQYAAQARIPTPVPEATALAECIRALDIFTSTRTGQSDLRVSYSTNMNSGYTNVSFREQSGPERILRALAAKYGVDLVEVRHEPCAREHLDQASPGTLIAALNHRGVL